MRIELILSLAMSMAVAAGCSDDESTDDGSGGDGGTGDAGSDDGGSGDGGGTDDGGGSDDGGGGTGDTGDGESGTGDSGTGDGGTSGDDGATGDDECGDQPCDAGQVCVFPCCGGAPGCYPADANGMCLPGDMPIDASDCMAGCDVDPCCEGTCEPPPTYCIDEGDLVCGGEVPDQCSTPNGDCYGTKEGNELHCTCG